jgi:signal transduction histidine kinase
MLTGLGLNLDAARARLAAPGSDPAQVDEFLAYAKDAAVQVITDLRGMVYDLRPPALDDLGLVGALRLHAERLGAGAGMRVEVAADGLPDLPAAIEVAAFRTAVEALTNAARHGAAATCTIRLAAVGGPALVLDVTDHEPRRDQARKRPPEWLPGVGITAMRERAEELGGTLLAGPTATGGRVTARYPWPTRDRGEGPAEPAPVVPDRKGTDEELSEVAP